MNRGTQQWSGYLDLCTLPLHKIQRKKDIFLFLRWNQQLLKPYKTALHPEVSEKKHSSLGDECFSLLFS